MLTVLSSPLGGFLFHFIVAEKQTLHLHADKQNFVSVCQVGYGPSLADIDDDVDWTLHLYLSLSILVTVDFQTPLLLCLSE